MSYLSPNDSENRQNQNLILIRETEEDEFYKEQQLYKGAQLQKKNIQLLNSQINDFKQINKRNEDEVESIQQLTNNYFLKTNSQQESASVTQNSNFVYDIQNSGFSNSNKASPDQTNFRNIESHVFEQLQLHQVTFSKQQEIIKAKCIEELNVNESKLQCLDNKCEGQSNDDSHRFFNQDLSIKKNNNIIHLNKVKKTFDNQELRCGTNQFRAALYQNQTPSQRFRIAYQVFEFIKRIKRNVLQKNLKSLPQKFILLINDKSCGGIDINKALITNPFQNNILGKAYYFFINLQLFSQDFIICQITNISTLICILFYFFWIPLRFCFSISDTQTVSSVLYQTGIFVLLVSIFIKFNVKQQNTDGISIKDRKIIASQYLKSYQFLIELVTTFSIIYCESNSKSLVQFLFFLRLYQVKQLNLYIKDFILIDRRYLVYVLNLLSMTCLFLLYTHISACLFYYVGVSQTIDQESWIKYANLEFEQSQNTLYLYSFYFSWTTLLTIGYGDIVPVSNPEKIYVIINTIFNLFVQFQMFRFLIKYALNLMTETKDYQRTEMMVKSYLKQNKISQQLRQKIIRQLKQQNESYKYIQGEKITSQFNNKLQSQLKSEIYKQNLLNNKILKNIFTNEFLIQLSCKLKEVLLLPDSIIQKSGEPTNRLHLIQKGQIKSVFESSQDLEIDIYQEGSIIGLTDFLQNKPSKVTLKCSNYVILSYIEKDDFLFLLRQFQEDFEQYQMIFEQSNEKQQFDYLQKFQACRCCNSLKHKTNECPLITINYSSDYIIQRHNFVKSQSRGQYLQQRKKRYQTLLKLQQTKKVAKQKRMDLILQEQQEDKAILDIYEDIRNIIEWSDKQFLQRIPAFKIFQNEILIDYENGDEIDDEESDNKTYNRDLQKSSVLSPDAKTTKTHKTNKTLKTNKTNKTNKSNISQQNQESFTSVDKQSFFNQTDNEQPSIVENMKKQQRISKDSRLFMAQKRNSFKESRDQQRRVSDMLVEDFQQSQKSNQHRSFNESVPLSSNFLQSYFRLGSSQKDIQVYQPQSSKNLVLNKQNSLSSSQVMMLQGGRAIRKSDMYNSGVIDSSNLIQMKNRNENENEKRNSLLIQYNTNAYQSKVLPSNKKILLQEQQHLCNYLNMNTFENDFDISKEYRIFFPQHNLSRVIKNLNRNLNIKNVQ
ncbi:hypothetical protein ABPG74_021678 [Tetrahymena malaccensis]